MPLMSLEEVLREEKVPEDLLSPLVEALTLHSFACLATSSESVGDALLDILEPALHSSLTTLPLACIRAAHMRCLSMINPTTSQERPQPVAGSEAQPSSSSWTETFPAKMSNEKVVTLRKKFECDYPSEILDSHSMPSSRLLAMANKQVQDKSFSYISWRHRLSDEKLEEMQATRPRKVARFEDYFFDEIPSRDIPESGMSQMFLLHLLDLVAFAFCLLGRLIFPVFVLTAGYFLSLPLHDRQRNPACEPPTSMRCSSPTRRHGVAFVTWRIQGGHWMMLYMKWFRFVVCCKLICSLVHLFRSLSPGGARQTTSLQARGARAEEKVARDEDVGSQHRLVPNGALSFPRAALGKRCASVGIFAAAASWIHVSLFMAVALMLGESPAARTIRPTCTRTETARAHRGRWVPGRSSPFPSITDEHQPHRRGIHLHQRRRF